MFTRKLARAIAVTLVGAALAATSAFSATSAGAAAAPKSFVVTFEPGSAKLSSASKTLLAAKLEQLQLAPTVSLVGFSSTATKAKSVAKDALARAKAVKNYLALLGLTAATSTKSGGYSSRLLKPAVANRVVVSFTPTPGLIWVEEFGAPAGAAPNPAVFSALTGNGCQELGLCNYGTGEIEYNLPAAAATDGDGHLVIHAQKAGNLWTSARIWTARKLAFQYGTLEIRAKFPVGSFNWPAIWMLGNNYQPPNRSFGQTQWPASGELDIAEGLAANSVVQGTLHGLASGGGDWRGGSGLTAAAPISEVSGAFHTWGISWQPNLVIFTMDGVEYARDTFTGAVVNQQFAGGGAQTYDSNGNWPYNQPFFLILNNAIWASASAPDGASSDFIIDSIRYSKFNGYGGLTR